MSALHQTANHHGLPITTEKLGDWCKWSVTDVSHCFFLVEGTKVNAPPPPSREVFTSTFPERKGGEWRRLGGEEAHWDMIGVLVCVMCPSGRLMSTWVGMWFALRSMTFKTLESGKKRERSTVWMCVCVYSHFEAGRLLCHYSLTLW